MEKDHCENSVGGGGTRSGTLLVGSVMELSWVER